MSQTLYTWSLFVNDPVFTVFNDTQQFFNDDTEILMLTSQNVSKFESKSF